MRQVLRHCTKFSGASFASAHVGMSPLVRRNAPALLQCPLAREQALPSSRAFSTVSAALVKQLRDRTGASMGKCRSALMEEGGDVEKAVEWLRKKGIKSMEKRSGDSAESLLALGASQGSCSIVEIRAETDYVTRNAMFQQMIVSMADTVAATPKTASTEGGTDDALNQMPLVLKAGVDQAQLLEKAGRPLGETLLEIGSVLGERLILGRTWQLTAEEGTVLAGYVHPTGADGYPGTGKMAAIVALKASVAIEGDNLQRLQAAADKLARHIVAAQPKYLSVETIPHDALEKEQTLVKDTHLASMDPAKAAKIDEKMLQKVTDGKMNKFYQENVFVKQEVILGGDDGKPPSVEKWLASEAKAIGVDSVVVDGFYLALL